MDDEVIHRNFKNRGEACWNAASGQVRHWIRYGGREKT